MNNLNREEILEQAKIENKNKDVAEKDIRQKSYSYGYIFGVIVLLIVMFIDIIALKRNTMNYIAILTGTNAGVFLYNYVKKKSKYWLIFSIIHIALTIVIIALFAYMSFKK